jgi:hypothetical protein
LGAKLLVILDDALELLISGGRLGFGMLFEDVVITLSVDFGLFVYRMT